MNFTPVQQSGAQPLEPMRSRGSVGHHRGTAASHGYAMFGRRTQTQSRRGSSNLGSRCVQHRQEPIRPPQNRFNPVTAKPWRDSELRSGASFRVIQGGSSLSCSRRVLATEIGSPTIVILVTKCRLKTFVGYSALRHSLRMWDDGGPVGDG